MLVYLVLAMPFLFAGSAIGLALATAGKRIGRVYRSDLLGAGIGSLGVIGLLWLLPVADCFRATAAVALVAATLAFPSAWKSISARLVCIGGLALLWFVWPEGWLAPRPSPYKELSLALTVPGAHVLAERHGPLGQLAVVESPSVPFRWAPGQSLTSVQEPPEQLAVFTDGSGMTAITRFDGDLDRLRYLDEQTAALPYHLRGRRRVLILGAGGGADVLLARLFRAPMIDAVELDPRMVELVRSQFADFAGHIYELAAGPHPRGGRAQLYRRQ